MHTSGSTYRRCLRCVERCESNIKLCRQCQSVAIEKLSGRMKKQAACPVSRASAGLTEYLIVSSQPPTGYYVDGVTACSVSRASAGLTEYLIVSKGVNLILNSVGSDWLQLKRCLVE